MFFSQISSVTRVANKTELAAVIHERRRAPAISAGRLRGAVPEHELWSASVGVDVRAQESAD